jgi:RND superfamily putative drug exporter
MPLDAVRWLISRHPWWIILAWILLTLAIGLAAPNLTQLAAEGQAHLLPTDAESVQASKIIASAWPDLSYESIVLLALHRPGGLTPPDRDYARQVSRLLESPQGRPAPIARTLGPDSPPEIAERLVSRDGTTQLVLVPLSTAFVSPVSFEAINWIQAQADLTGPRPAGLELLWTGDAIIGRDYMASVQESLDRAAIVTVVLLLVVLLFVYRSFWLAILPLGTIGMSLAISRGVLAWMAQAGWAISPLVELFLVVILFGCGTDFCLYLSWRFAEHYQPDNPAGAMRVTLRRSTEPLLTSAGTVMIGLLLMGVTKFKLFSSTGPSVALGLLITLVASLTLMPALLLILARIRPSAFHGLVHRSHAVWDEVARAVLARPALAWCGALALMAGPAIIGLQSGFIQDLFSELPRDSRSVQNFRMVAEKFGAGTVAPLTLVLETNTDLRSSQGLAFIDDITRTIDYLRSTVEVRSATRPLGNPATLEPARIASRLEAVNEGFTRMAEGADQLRSGLNQGAARLRTAMQIEQATGMTLTGSPTEAAASARRSLMSGLGQAMSAVTGPRLSPRPAPGPTPTPAEPAKSSSAPKTANASSDPGTPQTKTKGEDPRALLLRELTLAAEGANQIGDGARRAQAELQGILRDPVGQLALERLLITPRTVQENPELRRSFDAYITPDGKLARFDVTLADRIFSTEAMNQVDVLRRRLKEHIAEQDIIPATVSITGANAQSADVRDLTQRDQQVTWVIVPLGVLIVLWIALRDFLACVNLVVTMLLTYAFSLGVTHVVFVNLLGAEAVDWKVPYFLFVLLVAVGVDYNIFLMSRLQEEARLTTLKMGIRRAIGQTGGLITSAAAITASSFASFLSSPLTSIRQLGLALVVGIVFDAVLVRPILVPCGHWLLYRVREWRSDRALPEPQYPSFETVLD